MRIVSFSSGLGNQVFIYLLVLYLRSKYPNEKIYGYYNPKWLKKHNGIEVQNVFNINLPPATKFSNFVAYFIRATRKFIKGLEATDSNISHNAIFYRGFWQDKKFFLDNVKKINYKTFELSHANKLLLEKIMSCDSVSLHVRRGDYLEAKHSYLYSNICTSDYYKKAISIASTKYKAPVFFIFSNDIKWCKENIQLKNVVYVNNNSGNDSYLDMFLMSHCKCNILANSSFSYWGAMFNVHSDNYVIYPSKWNNIETPDIFPNYWHGL